MPVKPKSTLKSKTAAKPDAINLSPNNDFNHLAQDIINNIAVGIYIVQNNRFVYVSPLFQKISGYSHAELIGRNPIDLIHPDDKERTKGIAINSLKGKNPEAYEYRFIKKNSNLILALERVTSIQYKGQRAALGSFIDITERKRMDESLRHSEQKYRTILENIEDGYAEMDLRGNFIFFNEALCKIQGYPRKELLNKNYRKLMDEENAKKIFKEYNEVFNTGKSKKEVPYEVITKNGTRKYLETSITPMKDASGRVVAFRGIVRDRTEHKQAEETLRWSEEKYRNIIETIQDGYFETALNGDFMFVNDIICQHLKYSKEELIGMNNRQYQAPENANKTYQAFKKVYETGKPVIALEMVIIRKDGTIGVSEVSISLIRDAEGNPVAFRGISRDITERKQMEELIRQSEEKYRTIIETIHDAYYETDLAGKITFMNHMLSEHLGYSREELIGKNSRMFQDETNFKKTVQFYTETYQTKNPTTIEMQCVRKDGTKGTYELSLSLIRDDKGKIIGFRGVSRDVTKRKQMEESMRQSEERYRTILEQMNDAYFEIDLAGKYTFVTEITAHLLKYSLDELIGKNSLNFIAKEDVPIIQNAFSNIYQTGKPEKNIVYRAIHKDGEIGIAELTGFPLKNAKGEIIGFRGIARDVTNRKQMEETIKQSEERYRSIIEQMEDGYFETDISGKFTFVNDAECISLGYSREELVGVAQKLYTDEKSSKAAYRLFNEVYKTGMPVKAYDLEITKKDGTKAIHEISVILIKNATGEPAGFRGISRDVTNRKQMEETIRQSEERYRTIIEQMEDGYFETDLRGHFTFVNEAECRNMGYPRKELLGMNQRKFSDERTAQALYKLFNEIYKTGKPVRSYDISLIKKDGTKSFNEISAALIRNAQGEPTGFRGIARDVTERKRAEERIKYLATHDGLTNLPNRLMFSQLLNHAIQAARRYQRKLAVFFIDLDRFKMVNDTLGHEAGDQLLQEISIRFRQSLRAVDVIARLGGDEFVIMIEEVNDLEQVAIVAHKILAIAIKPMTIMGEDYRITSSIGISVYPKDGEDEQTLLKNADLAMYFAKEEGKNNFQFYSKDIKSQSVERLSMETNLRFALERNELTLVYQAKLDFKTNVINGVEALLRWNNPALGSITPTQFIPVAEETGLIVPIGRWVLKTACAQNVAWQRQGLAPVCMAVNLSLRQLLDENLIEDIEKALKESGMSPKHLELEITESMVMHSPTRMIGVLAKIKNLGVRLAIDDFGTGYSSLAQIKHFPIDTLKVDRSFIRNIPQDAEDKAITEAIIAMGKTLSLTVVAEGVETIEQMNFLKDHSCDEMQGYYFSKPVIPEQFADLLRKHVPSPRK